MYESFFKLKEKPFNITPSHRFLYLSEGHKEALSLLTYGVVERKGFILLTGDVGTGKTTVIQALLSNLGTSIECIHFSNPLLSSSEFMDYLASSTFKKRVHFKSKADFLFVFEDYLKKAQQQQTTYVLIIDEAQTLSFDLLEEIRLLSNLESSEEKLINIFLVGQPELIDRLKHPRCRALYQRIASRYHLQPLNLEETGQYISTRLSVAGADNPDGIFSKSAIEAIYSYSRGIPRIINILADNALLLGYSKGKSKISRKMIEESHRDMHMGETHPTLPEGPQHRHAQDAERETQITEKRKPWLRKGFGLAFVLALLLGSWAHLSKFNIWEFIPVENHPEKPWALHPSRSNVHADKADETSTPEPTSENRPISSDRQDKALLHEVKPDMTTRFKNVEIARKPPDHSVSPHDTVSSVDQAPLVPSTGLARAPVLPTTDLVEETEFEGQPPAKGDSGIPSGPFAGEKRIVVKKGDYLTKLALSVYGRADRTILEMVKQHNPNIRDIHTIEVGQVIVFPDLSSSSQEKIYTVHVASYRPGKTAQEAFRGLLEAGYDVFIVPFTSSKNGGIYRITIGNFKDKEKAKAYAHDLLKKGEFEYANPVQLEMDDSNQ